MFSDDEWTLVERYLSAERLAPYIHEMGDLQKAYEQYQVSVARSALIAPVMAILEVSIRNEIVFHMDRTLGGDWLLGAVTGLKWKNEDAQKIKNAQASAKRAAYAKLLGPEKQELDLAAFPNGVPKGVSHEKRAKKRQAHVIVSRGQIISQLTLFFWKRLFSDEYERTIWKRSLKSMFPNKKLNRPEIAMHFECIYQMRNRLAHHEPISGRRLENLQKSIDFISRNMNSVQPSIETVLAKMLSKYVEALKQTI